MQLLSLCNRDVTAMALAGLLGVSTSAGCAEQADCAEQNARVTELEHALQVCETSRLAAEAAAAPEVVPPAEPEPPPEPARAWERREGVDELTGRPIISNVARSQEEFELDFPYQGRQRARLTLREHPRFGNDVMLSVDRGQILCHSSRCTVDVVFGGGDPIRWRADPSDSGSSEVVFLSQHDRFVRELRRAPEVRIALTFYRSGARTFTFPGLPESSDGSRRE